MTKTSVLSKDGAETRYMIYKSLVHIWYIGSQKIPVTLFTPIALISKGKYEAVSSNDYL